MTRRPRDAKASKPMRKRWTVELGIPLLLVALTGCFQERWVEGGFLGTFVGYALPEDGFPVPLRIETALLEKEERRYTFTGEARLGETSYRVEGFEESLGNVHYLAVPPTGGVAITFFDADDVPRYKLHLPIFYERFGSQLGEGHLYQGDELFGTVQLQSRIETRQRAFGVGSSLFRNPE